MRDIKDEMFEGAADVILSRLANAAEAVGKALCEALQELAEKVRYLHYLTYAISPHIWDRSRSALRCSGRGLAMILRRSGSERRSLTQ